MSIRQTGQLSLADGLAMQPSRLKSTLDRIDSLVDWEQVDTLLAPLRSSRYGAPGYPPLLMLKALLLQQWYVLSDPGLEEALIDRLSFRRFAGLALGEAAPDHSTISRFRTALGARGLSEAVFEAVNLQIDAKGLILRQGTLIDATLVEAHVKRPKKPKENKTAAPQAASGEAAQQSEPVPIKPRPASKLLTSPTDPEASWAKKGHTRYFGYKGHVAVDLGSGIIRRCILTTAKVADTTAADALVMGDERAVYADKAYDTKARRTALKAAGAKDRIAHRPNKHHPLSKRQEQRNEGIARRRAAVERVFAIAKRLMGWRRVRYIGVARNAGHFALLCTAINLKRLAVLAA
ncbi:MAG: IS5 family transposase [Bradyrhizobium sp.]